MSTQSNLRYRVDAETELNLIKRRAKVQQAKQEYERYSTLREIKQFQNTHSLQPLEIPQDESSAQQTVPDKAQKGRKSPKDNKRTLRKPLDLLSQIPKDNESKPVILAYDGNIKRDNSGDKSEQEQQDYGEISSDIEIEHPENFKRRETFRERLEQIKNQAMMEREDKDYIERVQK